MTEANTQTSARRFALLLLTGSLLFATSTANAWAPSPSVVSTSTTGGVKRTSSRRQQPAETRLLPQDVATSSYPTKLHSEVARGGASEASGGGTATIPNEVFNLVKSIVGAGVLSLPYGVAAFGNAPSALVPAVALIALMGVVSGYTFGLIGRVCQKSGTLSYSEAWDKTVGTSTSWLIAFSCFIDCFAGNLSYSMILADTTVNLLASTGVAVGRTPALLGVTGLVLAPLCFVKNLAALSPFSLVGLGGMLYTTVAMGLRYFGSAYAKGGAFFESQLATPVFGAAGAASAFSPKSLILMCMLSNAYIAHFNSPRFLKELKNNTMARFHQVIGWSFATSILLYSAITAFGFLTFGAASNGLILNNYANKDFLMSISRIAVAISVTCSYPLIFVGARDGIFDLFKVKQENRNDNITNKVTVALIAIVTLMASQLTDLGLVASVGGATFGTALVFIYPCIMFLKQQTKRTAESIPAALISILGLAMGAIGTVLSIKGVA